MGAFVTPNRVTGDVPIGSVISLPRTTRRVEGRAVSDGLMDAVSVASTINQPRISSNSSVSVLGNSLYLLMISSIVSGENWVTVTTCPCLCCCCGRHHNNFTSNGSIDCFRRALGEDGDLLQVLLLARCQNNC